MLREVGFGDLAKEIVFVPKPYPPEFRRRALDLLESGRSVRDVAAALGIAESCLHRWKRREGGVQRPLRGHAAHGEGCPRGRRQRESGTFRYRLSTRAAALPSSQ
ncbi:transposase [Actinomadura coerulea]|uniref:transposase n=1 Tax=Actinomadura coerulea TaxID=46159 RepID=UPI001612FB5B